MTITIWYTATNQGDGSSGVEFWESAECITLLEEHDPETYAAGEGGSSFIVEGNITGIYVGTLEEAKEQIGDIEDEEDY